MSRRVKQKGVVALVFAMTVLAIITIITLFTARVITTDTKIYSNVENNADAYNAAMAGFQYALGYLNANPYAVVGSSNPVGLSFCASAATTYALPSGTLSNGATYTMTFSCITAGDFITFNLTAVGTSADGTSTRTVRATLKNYCGVNEPLITQGNATLNDTTVVSNTDTNAVKAIDSGATVTLNDTTSTNSTLGGTCNANYTSPPSTTCANIRGGPDLFTPVTNNLTVANGMSNANFELLYLGRQISTVVAGQPTTFSNLATYVVNCTGNATFNNSTIWTATGACTKTGSGTSTTLGGITGAIVYINLGARNLTIITTGAQPTFTFGSAAAPAILVVNTTGNVLLNTANTPGHSVTINGNIYAENNSLLTIRKGGNNATGTTVNGLVFSTGSVNLGAPPPVNTGTAGTVNGAVVANVINLYEASSITYNSTNISNTFGGYCGGAYAIVPGSWRDF